MSDVVRPARDRRYDGRPEQARPRDRTGRPLPYGTTGVATIEAAEPATVEEALALGMRRWDERRYFEAHELLEHAWKHAQGDDRELWQGIIQVAVAGVHLQRGNPVGARRLLDRALGRLAPLPDVHRGIDLARLRAVAERTRAALEHGASPVADWGPFPGCGDGTSSGPWFTPDAAASGPGHRPTPIVP